MHTPTLKSSSLPEPCKIDFSQRINDLHSSLLHQFESSSNVLFSSEQIFHRISIIFRFLRKNLHSQDKLADEYLELSNQIQKLISLSTRYIQDRHDHENEFIFLKDQICQILGQIGYVQYSLEQHWTIITNLEQEIQRLQTLLSNPQILQINQKQFQILQENQKIKIDRISKENEKIKILIEKQIETNRKLQIQIDYDLKDLGKLKQIVEHLQSKQINLQNQWKDIEKQSSNLQTHFDKIKITEDESNNRLRIVKTESHLAQKRLQNITNIRHQTQQRLISIQKHENTVKEDLDKIKTDVHREQTRSSTCRNQIKSLQEQLQKLNFIRHHTHHFLKSKQHTNYTLERKQLSLERQQSKLNDQIRRLLMQLFQWNNRVKTNEQKLSQNNQQINRQQSKIRSLELALTKLQHLNNNLEKILIENRAMQTNERENLRSIKQISFQKRKQLIVESKRLHNLSLAQHRINHRTLQNSLELIRLNKLNQTFHYKEKSFQLIIRKKQTDLMKREKRCALLARSVHDHENRNDFLIKKNQFIEKELENKIEHFHFLEQQFTQQKSSRLILFNQKQQSIYAYRQQSKIIDNLHQQFDHFEQLSDHENHHLIKIKQDNERLKSIIYQLKQKIINQTSQNNRYLNEYILLNEKIELYMKLNNQLSQQEKRYQFEKDQDLFRILNLEKTNKLLYNRLENQQKKIISIAVSHHEQVRKRDQLNRTRIYRPMTSHLTEKSPEDYSKYTKQLIDIIHQCIQWRERLRSIDQLYFMKIEQIHKQKHLLSTEKNMFKRYRNESRLKQCQALTAESQIF